MQFRERIVPISEAKSRTAALVEEIAASRTPVVITQNGRACAVLEDMQTYEETRESLALLKILALSQAAARSGKVKPARKAFRDAKARGRASSA